MVSPRMPSPKSVAVVLPPEWTTVFLKPLNLTPLKAGLQRISQKEATKEPAHVDGLSRFINLDNLRLLAGHDITLLFSLLNTTRDENQRNMPPLLQAGVPERLDRASLPRASPGRCCRYYCANTIAQQCRSLEKACEKQTLSAKAEMLPRLQTLLANLAALNHAISTYTTPR